MKYLKSKSGSLENSILNVWSEAAKKEGNAFGQAVTSAKEKKRVTNHSCLLERNMMLKKP